MNKLYIQQWNKFISELSSMVDSSESEAWINSLQLIKVDPDNIVLGGLNRFFCDWIKTNRSDLIQKIFHKHFSLHGVNKNFKLSLKIKSSNDSLLSQNHSFESFVNGNNSNIAYAAAKSVAENINNTKYNPLFICGSVGLGKTHLLQAIGLESLEKNKDLNVYYCSSEKFTNDVIEGIRFQNIDKIRSKYRNLDVLLIDDIQFLENKDSTQEEFFHTFNSLIQNNKQIVLTADRYPKEIKNIEERLISRFSAGMITKIEKPDFETRVAIIRNEVKRSEMEISDEVIEHIAHVVKSNVRDIKGILIMLEAEWSLLKHEITLESARIILRDVLQLDKSPISIGHIIQTVSNKLNVKVSDIISEKRERDISIARQTAMFISREVTDLSYPVIGRYFDKNHASVIQACKRTKLIIEENPEQEQFINSIIKEITN